jgi:hypothetical protein
MRRFERWPTRKEREAQRAAIAQAGGVSAWIRNASKRKPITDEERAKKAAVNALAHKHGFPRPYPDLGRYPRADA